MALLFGDGMDNWTTIANVTSNEIWSSSALTGNGFFTKGAASGRFGGGGLICANGNDGGLTSGAQLLKLFSSTFGTLILSFAVNFGNNSVESQFATFRKAGVCQVSFTRVPSTGLIKSYSSYDGGGGTLLGTSASAIASGGWHWVSIKVVCHSSSGTVDVVIDGANYISLTGQNTSPVAGNLMNGFDVSCRGFINGGHTFDDVLCNDTSGSGLIDLVPDRRIITQSMVGAGVNTQWTPLASTNVSQINESPGMDSDGSYNSDATAGHIDDFTHGTLTSVASIDAVILKTYARKDDAGARNVIPLILSGGTEGDGATKSLSTSYQAYMDIFLTDPHTSAAWIKANWDAATVGYKNV